VALLAAVLAGLLEDRERRQPLRGLRGLLGVIVFIEAIPART